ncbi:MAG: hypothetical protein GKR93_14695 [Gammaproteobacteria bacterium]|nr:hypothetical protein [Gammaproteobacteria bacterium]
MKKRYIAILIALLLLAGAGFLIYKSLGSLDKIIQTAVETYGSEMMQAEVKLGGVSLDFEQGQASLNGLYVGNPSGYDTEYAVKLEHLNMTLDLGSLTSNTILIKEVLVQSPDLILEKKEGVSNFDTLMNNINTYIGLEDEGESTKDGDETSVKMIIDDLYIKDAKAGISYQLMQGNALSVSMPDIHLEDIGKSEGGIPPGEVVGEIMSKLSGGISSALGGIKDGAGKVMDKLKGLFD